MAILRDEREWHRTADRPITLTGGPAPQETSCPAEPMNAEADGATPDRPSRFAARSRHPQNPAAESPPQVSDVRLNCTPSSSVASGPGVG